VLELAPDAASAKAGRGQAAPAKWSDTGASDRAVWGACQGSGKHPYLTAVETAGPAFKCSCPSRKFPCKHALGLLLLWADGRVPRAEEPGRVHEWLDARASRAEKKPDAPKDLEAAAKRAEERLARVTAGAAELRGWLADRVSGGFAAFERGGADELYTVASRMVDAQAPGLAGGLRRAAGLIGRGRDWPDRLLAELSLVYLLADAASRVAELPAGLAASVRSRLGFSVANAQVLESGERVPDQWLVTGALDEEQESLRSRRTWLRGKRSGRDALVLSFAPPGQSLDNSLPPGSVVAGELVFHPAAVPQRAVFDHREEPMAAAPESLPPGDSCTTALAGHAAALADDPWLDRWPMLLSGVSPARHGDGWALSDSDGAALPLAPAVDPWPLLAVAAERPVMVAAEWTTAGLRPLSCWHRDGMVRL